MLYYDRIDISKGIDLAKSNNCKKSMIYHYWILILDSSFKIMYAMFVTVWRDNISNIVNIIFKNVDYCCNIHNLFLKIVGIYKKILSEISVYSR